MLDWLFSALMAGPLLFVCVAISCHWFDEQWKRL
jgi:hypothetical protein